MFFGLAGKSKHEIMILTNCPVITLHGFSQPYITEPIKDCQNLIGMPAAWAQTSTGQNNPACHEPHRLIRTFSFHGQHSMTV